MPGAWLVEAGRLRDPFAVAELGGGIYVTKINRICADRQAIVQLLKQAVVESGARFIYSSFRTDTFASIYLGAEDSNGHRYGLLVYPFTTTRRETRNRPSGERRTQIRFGDPTREREQRNPIAFDSAGVDVTLALGVDPEGHARIRVGIGVMVVLLAGSVGVWTVECHSDGPIDTYEDALWWSMTAITTVGYGDTYPVTPEGRGIATFIMLAGIAIFGVVAANLASIFIRQPEQNDHQELLDRLDVLSAQVAELKAERSNSDA